jgi:hypothetical protein
MAACDNSDMELDLSPSNPLLEVSAPAAANFGDSIPFTLTVDGDVPLSTVTARLFYGEEEMGSTVIRTRTPGTYSGKLFAPFLQNIPDGTATLSFTMIDTHTSKVTKESDIRLTRMQYPYLILVTAAKSYPMLPTGVPNEYAATETFPNTDLPAYIKTPVTTENANEITFGWEGGAVTQGVTADIPFVSAVAGEFSVSFNTLTYAAAPFFEILFNGANMAMTDKTHYQIDVDITQGQAITVEGITDIADWWIDPDFLTETGDGEYSFVPISGRYRFIADLGLKYFRVFALNGSVPAKFSDATGTGAIWIIGEHVGKPNLSNAVGWNTGTALCMAPMGNKVYKVSFVAGEQINTAQINFKFFGEKDNWLEEFSVFGAINDGGVIVVGLGQDVNQMDKGNLALQPGVTLEAGATYVFTIDGSSGHDTATLTVEKL